MPKTSTSARSRALSSHCLDQQIGFLLRLTHQRVAGNLARQFSGSGLNVPRYVVLSRLYEKGPLTQNLLGRLVAMEPCVIHDMVRSLEARGLVSRRSDENDGRRRIVDLTDDGRSLIERYLPLGNKANEESLNGLSRRDREQLFSLLARLNAEAPCNADMPDNTDPS